MEDGKDRTPKLKPTFHPYNKFRRSQQKKDPFGAYRSPLMDSPSSPLVRNVLKQPTPKQQCHSTDSTSYQHSNVIFESGFTPRSSCSKTFCRKLICSSYRSPLRSSNLENKEEQTNICEESKGTIKSRVTELFHLHQNLLENIDNLRNEGCDVDQLKWYINKLHEYNDIKDVAQTVMGRLAVLEEISVKVIHQSFGLCDND